MFFRQIEVGFHAVFAYLIGDTDSGEAVVLDPADDVDGLIKLAGQNQLTIKYILNTHGHVDHIMGNAEMKEKTGAKIIIHEDEADYLDKISDFWLNMFNARKSPPADEILKGDDIFKIGSIEWKVLHTPGHTPGGICLYNQPYGICITGDTLFVDSVGRTDGPKSSWPQLFNSIKTSLMTLPDDTEIFPGHNYGASVTSTIGHERISNPFVNGSVSADMF
ncbi:MAG: MBL fold metallo-hydrolase [Deltaproteobacteria bacterium]|nr:MBL fold metallo-hydrolase [Deltaproteobacteria bacterium]